MAPGTEFGRDFCQRGVVLVKSCFLSQLLKGFRRDKDMIHLFLMDFISETSMFRDKYIDLVSW